MTTPTSPKRPNLLFRLVRGLYRGLDTSRRFAMNMIFLILVLVILAMIGSATPVLEERTALVIAPQGEIVEQYSADPADRALARLLGEDTPEVQLRDLLRALEAAARDPRIARVVLVPDRITGGGHATLRELGAAISRFRESGKEVVAYADALEQRGYYLAAHADRVVLHPDGAVLLEGIGRYRTYFKEAFEKFGIEARLFRVGEYKSAGEPYVRSEASAEAREADLYWMNDLWSRWLDEVAARRGIEAATLAADIEAYVERIRGVEGDLARLALEQKLVDELATRDRLRDQLATVGAPGKDGHGFRQIGLDAYLAVIDREHLPAQQPQVAVIVAEGEIVDGEPPPGTVGGESTAELLRRAREDDDVDAVVLRVDSPGGLVFPSELIRREVELTRAAGKPVVASMGDLAASGGYWISVAADEIVADPSTITGSIGVFGLWFNVPQALGKLGLRTDGSGTTWVPGAVDPTREFDPRLGEVIQAIVDRDYREFIAKVAAARERSPEEIDAVARGRVWSGAQAKERGLVDTLGTLQDAIASAAARAELGDDFRVRYLEPDLSAFDRFLVDISRGRAASWIDAGTALPLQRLLPTRVREDLAELERRVGEASARRPAAVYAHCECDLD